MQVEELTEEEIAHQMKMREMKKLAILNSKDSLHNKWGYMIIFSCLINITTGLQLVSTLDINSKTVVY